MHQLEQRHGVDLGAAYKTRESAHSFVHYNSRKSTTAVPLQAFITVQFLQLLMDGSTDKAKVENELIVLLYCSKDDEAEEMNTCARYFTVLEPAKADGDGLVQCLGKALQSMGIEDLVDRASVLGVKEHTILVGAWCYAHRLELACKDAFSSQLFHDVEEMLLKLYYLYEKSAKSAAS